MLQHRIKLIASFSILTKVLADFLGLKFKKADFALDCGGTNGYVPDMRFVFDRKKNNWELKDGKYKIPAD